MKSKPQQHRCKCCSTTGTEAKKQMMATTTMPSEDNAPVSPNASLFRMIPADRVDNGDASTSNLSGFLKHTTPRVPLQYLPRTCLWDNSIKRCSYQDRTPFFTLGDLWSTFDEWSAYGAGVPLVLNGKEAVVQYYVPYLSAMQLYTSSSCCLKLRKCGNESDASESSDYYRDSSSEASSDNESDDRRDTKFWRHCQYSYGRGSAKLKDYDASIREFLSDEEDNWGQKKHNHLFMEYFESAPPYSRVPLADKILELRRKIPELTSLGSCELLPSSWFSIAWYPIYRIPTGPTLKDLATCFLTYHSLSTPLQDHGQQFERLDFESSIYPEPRSGQFVLKCFGLASYKLRGAFWTAAGSSEKLLAARLEADADAWLKARQIRHPDYDFFASRSPHRR